MSGGLLPRTRATDGEHGRMRIELTTDGGVAAIPGLAKPILLDSATMSSAQCTHLQRLVDAALSERTQCASIKAAKSLLPIY